MKDVKSSRCICALITIALFWSNPDAAVGVFMDSPDPYSSTQLTCPADPEADRRPPVHSSSRTSRTRVGSVPSGSGASPPAPASPAWTDRRWRTR